MLMLTNKFYVLLSTWQYADVLLAFNILSAIVCCALYIKYDNINLCFLFALYLGLLTFTKNEGIVISLILIGLTGINLLIKHFKKGDWIKHALNLVFGYISIAIMSAYYKLFLTPPNPDIVPFAGGVKYKFLNWEGFMLIADAFTALILNVGWSYTWLIIIVIFTLFAHKHAKSKNLVFTFFVLSYAAVIIGVYLTTINFDLTWRLNFSLKRIMFYLLPSLLFINFKVAFESDEN